ncbi:MAG: 4-hydroxythreonine-4-phosphate dehydrogenase PdxA [Verrucomicrobium sp.]|nr:4-hydroxythreonine-4-phosphate dehydrogenase PdxA [Verrucomicrobium sp.]
MKAPVIAVTLGDPAGVGPEVAAAALRGPLPKGFRYEVVGKAGAAKPGRSTRRSARAAWDALERAAEGCRAGRYAAVVTGPVRKETLAEIGFPYPGQTEFLAAACGLPEERAVMAFWSPRLRVSLLSAHCSLKESIARATAARLRHVAGETARFLRELGIVRPRLAVAGINPHAGENGLFGREEARFAPVFRAGIPGAELSGPYPADTVFWRAAHGEFDGVVAANHDQGLAPFKMAAFHDGVNVTLGLPLVRTSPDHGTALALAGTGRADPRSMVAALRLAAKIVAGRARAAQREGSPKP